MGRLVMQTRQRRRKEAGSSLIEVMVAGLVFMVGLMGGMALIVTAIASNNRSKMDSTATLIAQKTMERIASLPANSPANSSVAVTDCNPDSTQATHPVSVDGSTSGSGASLSGGNIDFSATTVTNYSMTYYACQTSAGDPQGQYDVRWYVKALTGTTPTTTTAKLVVVAAQRLGTQTGSAKFYTRPVSLKMIVGL